MKNQIIFIQTMNINDKSVLEMLNKLIVINRLDNSQILQMVNLVSISNDINDLKDNFKIFIIYTLTKIMIILKNIKNTALTDN